MLLLLLFLSSSSGDDDDDSEEEEEDVEEGKLPLVLNLLKLLLLKLLKLLLLLIIPLLLKKCRATKRLAERAADILFIMKKENETFLRRKKVSLLYTKSIFTDSFDYELLVVNLL